MKLLFALLILVLVGFGGMVVLAHHDTSARANTAYKKLAPITVSFSRLRTDKEHLVSVYWRLRFTGKMQKMPENVAYWTLRPFRHVTLVSK